MNEVETNLVEMSVSELSGAVKRHIEGHFDRVRVRGEVGRVARPQSGHLYFDMKDDKAVLSAVMWKGVAQTLSVQPEQGLEIVAIGKLTTFAGQSRYQLVVESVQPAGKGALMALLEQRKKQLAAEGIFDEARKKSLPYLPQIIGVITSPSGAVIRDILHRLDDRFPSHVLVWPVRVQGENCAEEVARAIAGFNALPIGGDVSRPDLLIVARGGGSLEDLWGFNEEIVARTAAQSDIPLISAIGHETDTTLLDYAADHRAPTPTAAAEMAVPVRADLLATVNDLQTRLMRGQTRRVEQTYQHFVALARGLPKLDDLLARPSQRFDVLAQRLGLGLQANINAHQAAFEARAPRLSPRSLLAQSRRFEKTLAELKTRATRAVQTRMDKAQARLDGLARNLNLVSYEAVLQRGFALVLNEADTPVRTPADAPPHSALDIRLANEQHIKARVEKTSATESQGELL